MACVASAGRESSTWRASFHSRTAASYPVGASPSSISRRISRRAARVEVDVALADRRLLGQQARPRAAPPPPPARARGRCRRSRARGARSRCGSRPTCPCRRAAGGSGGRRGGPGSGSSCGRAAAPLGAEQGEHGLLVVLDVARVGGPAAEPRDGLGDPQRVAGADRLAQPRRRRSRPGGQRERARAQAVDARRRARRRRARELLEVAARRRPG